MDKGAEKLCPISTLRKKRYMNGVSSRKKNMHHKLRKGPQETLFGKPVLISKFIIAIYS